MHVPYLSQVEAYWESLRGDRPAPLRSEIDPRGIDSALEFAFILERISPGIARFRLAGMHLNDLMGMEVRGMPLTSFFRSDARHGIGEAMEHVFEQPAKVALDLHGHDESGEASLKGHMLLLPLRSDLGDISRALGCFVTEGAPGKAPHRFEIARSDIRSLAAPSDEFDTRPEPVARAGLGMSENSTRFDPGNASVGGAARSGDAAARRPHLRLVHDNDAD